MIEVLFGESEAASMKVAKSTVMSIKADGPTSIFTAGKKQLPLCEPSGWIEGTSAEVICLGFQLDIGNIQEEPDSPYRKKLLDSLYSYHRQIPATLQKELDTELHRQSSCFGKELRRLLHFLEEGEPIRIWYSEAPYSHCGFYHLCSILWHYENEVCVVKLPEYRVHTDTIIIPQGWGDVAADEFAGYLPHKRLLSHNEQRRCAHLWNELRTDNSPLRAVINGRLCGVPESFYDFLIWKHLTTEPIKVARLIGELLGTYQLGISDTWYAKRIDAFIAKGKIEIIEDSENKYARVIALRKNV